MPEPESTEAIPVNPLPRTVVDEVSVVTAEVEDIASTPEGLAALEAAVDYGIAEGHDE